MKNGFQKKYKFHEKDAKVSPMGQEQTLGEKQPILSFQKCSFCKLISKPKFYHTRIIKIIENTYTN